MAKYVDGWVIPIPKKNLAAYKKMATVGRNVWMDHGALEYRECIGEEMIAKWGLPFTKLAKLKAGETVVFAWVVYKNKAHRNKVNAKVMKDKRLTELMTPEMKAKTPFDMKRMTYGGFEVLVEN